MKRFLSLIKFMVAAGRDKCEAGRVASGKVNARSDPPPPPVFCKRVRKLLKIKDAGAKKSAKREQEAASRYKQKSWLVARLRLNFFGRAMGDTPVVLYRCETTRVAKTGFCKFLKTKATKNRW